MAEPISCEDLSQQAAVVGMSCRYPGDVSTPSDFWNLLQSGRDGFRPTSERFNAEAWYHPDRRKLHTIPATGAHYVGQDLGAFDAAFFNITHSDAMAMDPQQRLVLELAYEAFESAGLPLERLSGSATACYVGTSCSEWMNRQMHDLERAPRTLVTGGGAEFISNRVSWFFNLKGPSMTVKTACSSSLVALHLACQSLRAGESTAAIVGGANLLINYDSFAALADQSFLGSRGRCLTFDAEADGYGRGEGVGMVVLKRLDLAVRDGDPIRAVIRGSGANQDGLTPGITLPSSEAQAALIREVYSKAGLDMGETQYVECHGTGTKAGDPAELRAISETIGQATKRMQEKLIVGSVKPNIGHLEGGAGVAGLIKGVLALERGFIPPNIHFTTPNRDIPFDEWNLTVPTSLSPWPGTTVVRRVSVNSFGAGGTNAHVVLEDGRKYANKRAGMPSGDSNGAVKGVVNGSSNDAVDDEKVTMPNGGSNGVVNGVFNGSFNSAVNDAVNGDVDAVANGMVNGKNLSEPVPSQQRLLVLSAHDQAGLGRLRGSLSSHLARQLDSAELQDASYLADLAHTLGARRSRLGWKSFHIASTLDDYVRQLQHPEDAVATRSHGEPRIGFVFTGQGAQWARMGIELLQHDVFRSAVEKADQCLAGLGCPWSAWDELHRGEEESNINRPEYSQPICTVLQIALVDLLASWGIRPARVVGHSSGEIAAAYCAGGLGWQGAVTIAYLRGTASAQLAATAPELRGGMLAVGCSVTEAVHWVAQVTDGELTVACVNSPRNVTVSGDAGGLDQLQKILSEEKISATRLKIDTAYHSPHMHKVSSIYGAAMSRLAAPKQRGCNGSTELQTSEVPSRPVMISSVQAGEVDPSHLSSSYWVRNMVSPVLFSGALEELVAPMQPNGKPTSSSVDVLVEIGPHSTLKSAIQQTLEEGNIKNVAYESVLVRRENAWTTSLQLAGALFARGCPLDMGAVNGQDGCGILTDLPPYPWNHSRRFWPESRQYRESRARRYPRESLLGVQLPRMAENERLWRGYLRLAEEPWIRDHKLHSTVVFPGAGYIVMALKAANQLADGGRAVRAFRMRDVTIGVATTMTEAVDVEVVVQLRPHLLGTRGDHAAAAAGPWWEFSVSTCAGDRQELRQNCGGLVCVDYYEANDGGDGHMRHEMQAELAAAVTEHDGLEVSLPRTMGAEELYAGLRAIGLHFGDKFKNITRLRFGGGFAASDMVVCDPGETFSEGQHDDGRWQVIHPTTLDAILQTVVGSMWSEDKFDCPVPKSIGELEISPRLSAAPGTRLRGFCSGKSRGLRDTVADIDFFDDSRSFVAVRIRGYCSTEVTNVRDEKAEGSAVATRDLCTKAIRLPCLDLLTAQETGNLLAADVEGMGRMLQMTKVILGLYPETSILELSPSGILSPAATALLEPGKGEEPNYTVAICPSQLEQLKSGSHTTPDKVKFLPMDMECEQAPAKAPQFDLVLLPDASLLALGTDRQKTVVDNIASLLLPRGRAMGVCSAETAENIKMAFEERGFQDLLAPSGQNGFVMFSAPALQNGYHKEQRKILLLEPPSMTESGKRFSAQLQTRMQEQDVEVAIQTWGVQLAEDTLAGAECVSLLELERSHLEDLTPDDFETLKRVVLSTSSLLWVTGLNSPAAALIEGMTRVVRNELPDHKYQVLRLEPATLATHGAELIARVISSSISETEIVEQDGILTVSRIVTDAHMDRVIDEHVHEKVKPLVIDDKPEPLRLAVGKPGMLSSLYFRPDDRVADEIGPDEVEIQVKASGVNFRDIMTAMGILPETLLGCEAAGVVLRAGSDAAARYQPGDRVVAQVRGAHATILRAPASLCEALPAHVSFAEAAAVGVVHTTAYHALVNVARLRRGQSVLVHAAAGGVGQAAVQLARHLGLEVYATCGSVAKRALLRERYGLPDERILHSRDASFVAGIRRLTGGRGVDCVLNSLAGELLRQGFYCLAPFGTFVELGMRDVVANTRLDMAPFARQVSFSLVNLWEAMAEAPELMAAAVRETFANLAAGVIQPPAPLAVHHLQAHQDAFRLMQAGKHLGKLVLSFEGCNEVPVLCRPRDALRLDPAATYLLVGGLGGLGRSLATMMADSGARHLAFISRSGEGSPHAASAVCELTQRGCAVRICQADVADRASLASALAVCAMHLPPIRGVVQMAMVLQDAAFANMTHAQWAACTRPKVQGTRNLDEAFADLDFFVVLSSCAGVLGNRGQANYAAAGAYQDELAGSRHARGLRAVSVDLGIMRDVGVLAETGAKGDLRSWEATLGIREPEFHGLMKSVINAQRGWTAASSPQLITGLPTGTILARHGLPLPSYLVDNPIFSHLARSDAASAGSNGPQEAETSIGARLRGKSAAKAAEVVTTALVDKVAEILQSPASEIDPTRSLYTYGIDSLVAMEVRSWIVREMKADVALFDVLAAIPMRQFAGVIVEKSKLLVKGVE